MHLKYVILLGWSGLIVMINCYNFAEYMKTFIDRITSDIPIIPYYCWHESKKYEEVCQPKTLCCPLCSIDAALPTKPSGLEMSNTHKNPRNCKEVY